MPERFRGEFLTMGRYTNLSLPFTFTSESDTKYTRCSPVVSPFRLCCTILLLPLRTPSHHHHHLQSFFDDPLNAKVFLLSSTTVLFLTVVTSWLSTSHSRLYMVDIQFAITTIKLCDNAFRVCWTFLIYEKRNSIKTSVTYLVNRVH